AIFRRITGNGIPGSAVITQHMTLWVGFLGALLATGAGKHLALSTLDVVPAGTPRIAAKVFGQMTASAVTSFLAYASWMVIHQDQGSARELIGGIPFAYSQAVMPAACALMAARFAWTSAGGWPGRVLCFAAAVPGLVAAVGELSHHPLAAS